MSWKMETKILHAGEPEPRVQGAVCMPVFQSTMYELEGEAGYHDIRYIRLNNTPNHVVLHRKLAALENSEAALVTASGMAAISTSLMSVLKSGDHFLAQNGLYGGTHTFVTETLPEYGISVDFLDAADAGSWKQRLRPNTRAIYVEAMTNPLLHVADHKAVTAFAREHDLVSLIDSTFASPVNFRPIEIGYDLSIHSCTKYLNGHSDIVAGAVMGRTERIRKITHLLNHLGGSLDPHACFLLHRGMKTLSVRMKQHNESALKIAQFLETHPAVSRVNYPGLESHPHHSRARELFHGCGGVISWELKSGLPAAEQLIGKLKIPIHTVSLGGVETLITRPAATSHSGLTAEERRRFGIPEGLVRLSVGIESTDDLIEDLRQAL